MYTEVSPFRRGYTVYRGVLIRIEGSTVYTEVSSFQDVGIEGSVSSFQGVGIEGYLPIKMDTIGINYHNEQERERDITCVMHPFGMYTFHVYLLMVKVAIDKKFESKISHKHQ